MPQGRKTSAERRRLADVLRGQGGGVRVDVREDRSVDPDRGVGPGVVRVARVEVVGQLVPVPERGAGVASLDGPVEVVPVVEDPELDSGGIDESKVVDRLVLQEKPQETEDTVEHPDVGLRGDDRRAPPPDRPREDHEALVSDRLEVLPEVQGRDEGRRPRRPDHERALPRHLLHDRDLGVEKAPQPAAQLLPSRLQGGRGSIEGDLGDRRPIGSQPRGIGDGAVPQPQLVPVLGPRAGRGEQRGGQHQRHHRGPARELVIEQHWGSLPSRRRDSVFSRAGGPRLLFRLAFNLPEGYLVQARRRFPMPVRNVSLLPLLCVLALTCAPAPARSRRPPPPSTHRCGPSSTPGRPAGGT